MIIFNIVGIVMMLFSGVIAWVVSLIIGSTADGPLMMLAGSYCILFDASYRIRSPQGHWISPFGGGHVLFIPIWLLGVIWMVVGTIYCFTRPMGVGVFGAVCLALLILVALVLTVVQLVLYTSSIAMGNSSPKVVNDVVRCPACNMPCDVKKVEDGMCSWCGEPID